MPEEQAVLKRELGLPGAVLLGLGSILGSGVFVAVGAAAGVAGAWVVAAVAVGALLAICNGLSSAQLAASHPVAGGTYAYGYRFLSPDLGFAAGWLFLLAKSASAATAALGFSGYLLTALGMGQAGGRGLLALAAVAVVTVVVLSGLRRSVVLNAVAVAITLLALAAFVLAGLPAALAEPVDGIGSNLPDGFSLPALLHASALMFVAYTGYGRLATLGEEVRDPARIIPRAIVLTLAVSLALYLAVAAVGVRAAGPEAMARATAAEAAPLEVLARGFGVPLVPALVALGAVTAMLGVLLNLLLGLSRVLLAMGRQRDVPALFSRLDRTGSTPVPAVAGIGAFVALLVLVGDVGLTWTFSAFTVLLYYALTNLAALRLPSPERRYPRWIAWTGLIACVALAAFIPPRIWLAGAALLALGFLLRGLLRARRPGSR